MPEERSAQRALSARLPGDMRLDVLQFDRCSLYEIFRPMLNQDDPTKGRRYKKQKPKEPTHQSHRSIVTRR